MPKKFVFKRNQTIGAASAESDSLYLDKCFVDTGDLEILKDCRYPRNILVGRTGSGKSALILKLCQEEDHVIQISPESLSLSYIANSNIIRFFSNSGVKMDIFYRLLWRHILCVELLKERFDIENEEKKRNFLEKLWSLVPKKKQHEKALDYLRKWGESFWEETEYRVKEVTTTLETELKGTVEGKIPDLLSLNAGAANKLSNEEKSEIIHRAQEVVNKVQIGELSNVIKLIDDVLLENRQLRYYITIDRLDEDWVEDLIKYRLIRALIETSVELTRIENLKVIVVVRNDLLDRVYRSTRDTGFQEEKYQSCTLNVTWNKNQLINILDNRINFLIKDQYTSQIVSYKDLLPGSIGKQTSIDYLLERTLLRPRDTIQFFNACIRKSDGKPKITVASLRDAEGEYSRDRLKALFDEWQGLYPNLPELFPLLKGKGTFFTTQDITCEELEKNYLQLLTSGKGKPGLDYELLVSAGENNIDMDSYRKEIVFIFYKVALIGLKIDSTSPYNWSHLSGVSVSSSEISDSTKIQIHKTFWRVLGVFEKERR